MATNMSTKANTTIYKHHVYYITEMNNLYQVYIIDVLRNGSFTILFCDE